MEHKECKYLVSVLVGAVSLPVCCVQRKSLMRTKERNVSLKLFQRVFAPAAVRDSNCLAILAVRVKFGKEFLNYRFTHLKVQYLDKLISMYIIELY